MDPFLEVRSQGGFPERVPLDGERVTVGKDGSNDIALPHDKTASRLHAVFERYPAGWCVKDLSSSNGTFVNGERVLTDRPLRSGDEIRIGRTQMLFFDQQRGDDASRTNVEHDLPAITPREKDVLVALCRPVLSGDVFTAPAAVREIAAELVVTETAVKEHLGNLYRKFDIEDGDRRIKLANEALRRGAVSLADLGRADER